MLTGPCVEAHMVKIQGDQTELEWNPDPLPTALWQNPLASWFFCPSPASRWCSPSQKLHRSLGRDPVPEPPRQTAYRCVALRNYEIVNACCFKALTVWVICYTDKWYNAQNPGLTFLTDFNFSFLEFSKTNRFWVSLLFLVFNHYCDFCYLELNFLIKTNNCYHTLSIYPIPGMCTHTFSYHSSLPEYEVTLWLSPRDE